MYLLTKSLACRCIHIKGRDDCNDFSIGIELEGSEDDIFEDIQYEKLSQITEILLREYTGISKEDIKGHSDIAPGRKTDPGILFDWIGI